MAVYSDLENGVFIATSVFVVIANVIEVVLLLKRRTHLLPYELLLVSLSVADLLVGVAQCAVSILWLFSFLHKGAGAPMWTSVAISTFHVQLLTHDRLFAVAAPFKHKVCCTKRSTLASIACVWVLSASLLLPIFIPEILKIIREIVAQSLMGLGCLLIIAYAYIIYKTVISRRRNPNLQSSRSVEQRKRDRRLVYMSVMITFMFLSLTLPFAISERMLGNRGWNHVVPFILRFALLLNSLMNTLIYFFWKFIEDRAKKRNLGVMSRNSELASSRLKDAGHVNIASSAI